MWCKSQTDEYVREKVRLKKVYLPHELPLQPSAVPACLIPRHKSTMHLSKYYPFRRNGFDFKLVSAVTCKIIQPKFTSSRKLSLLLCAGQLGCPGESHCGLLRIPDWTDLFLAGDVLSPRFCDKYKPADHKMHGQKLAPTAKPPPMPYQTKDCKLHVQGEFILDLRAQVAKRCRNSMIQYFVTLQMI